MKYQKFGDVYAVRIDRGEEIVEKLLDFAAREGISAASVCAIGATDHVECGLYDVEKKKYISRVLDGMFEITALCGNLTLKDGKPYCHLHITVADEQGSCFGGHLNSAVISATCEMFVTVCSGAIGRTTDSETGLNIFDL